MESFFSPQEWAQVVVVLFATVIWPPVGLWIWIKRLERGDKMTCMRLLVWGALCGPAAFVDAIQWALFEALTARESK